MNITRYWVARAGGPHANVESVGNNHHQADSILAAARSPGSRYRPAAGGGYALIPDILITPVDGRWVEVVPESPKRCTDPAHDLALACDLRTTGRSWPIGDGNSVVIDGTTYPICVPWSALEPERLIVPAGSWQPGRLIPASA